MEEVGASNPTPFDQQIRPGRPYGPNNQPFGPKDQRWHADPAHYDQCCDQELHVAYSLYTLPNISLDPVTFPIQAYLWSRYTFLVLGYGFNEH